MNGMHTDGLFTIERTPARTRLLLRHQPALLPGPLTSARNHAGALRQLAHEVAGRLNECRRPACAGLRRAAPSAWLPLLLQPLK